MLFSYKKPIVKWQIPEPPQLLHYFAQFSYVLIIMYYVKAAKYWDWYLESAALAYLLNYIGYKFILKKEKIIFNITPLLINTSLFIFITGYSFWTYALAISIAMLVRFLIRFNNKHIFNPSAISVVIMICLGEGVYATPVIALADRQWWVPYIIVIGTMTTFFSRRIIASLAYWISLLGFIAIFYFLGAHYIVIQVGTIFSFLTLLFTFHVLTDPQTTPSNILGLLFFGFAIAFIDVILRTLSVSASSMIALNIVTAANACLFAKDIKIISKLGTILSPVIVVIIGIFWGYFPKPYLDPMKYDSYQKISGSFPPLPFHYQNNAKLLGLFFEEDASNTLSDMSTKSFLFNSFPAPNYSVGDLDNDGYFDLMISGSRVPFILYKNLGGNKFENVTSKYGINEQISSKIVTSVFIDFDNDGKEDIFGITEKSLFPFVLFKNMGGRFEDITDQVGLDKIKNPGRSTSIALLDYNRDGYLDILIANYPIIEDIPDKVVLSKDFIYSQSPKKNIFLQNNMAKNFTDITNSMNLAPNEFTHAIGVSDLNNDGYPDLYFANDVGRDKVYFNQAGKTFKNVTQELLGHIFARNGMGVDFTDIEGTGFQSIYVSNTSKGAYRHGMNYFWSNFDGKHFENKSNEYDIGRCGYSWGPKFFDPDLDGNTDLIVGAGFKNGTNNAWYIVNTWESMPNIFKAKKFIADQFPKDLELGGNQHKCLFWKKDKRFIDVAVESGISDIDNSRTITLLDMKNNGNPLILTGNFHRPRLAAYENIISRKNNWVGLNLIGVISNRNAIGAKVIYEKDNKKFTRELFPTNGVSSLHDRRIIIGLANKTSAPWMEVVWPSGKRQQISNLVINTYNQITEK